MATTTVTDFVTKTINATASATSTHRAAPQGGVFEGMNPSHYDPKNPIILFIIQAAIVIIFTRIIHLPLAKLRQPRVIAEVITGIILGPSIMGRIPGFTAAIFPTTSMPAFSLAANLGLVLFLFLVGLEVDLRFLASNWRIALSVGAAGMAIPFGLGAAIAWGLYHEFRIESGLAPISFGIYMLFIGVAMAITAFPVLCRILTSLKLLSTPVGVIVLSAGVGNDVVGWILLALCVALVNSGAGLAALWILLVGAGYSLFLVFAVRPCLIWLLRRTGSLANGPTQTVVALTVLLVLASSLFTGIIGIHVIFGAFMVGLICPHEGGFAIKLTEKLEDLVSVLFLPLYFALSGLSTNLGLLDSGITWAYVVGVCAIAFFGKIVGGTLASRLNGLVWRESLTIGCLMSCKGLVELIVLNIGLQAKILSVRTFTIFVVMALVTTFATTPLVTWLYPPWYQQKLELWKQGKIDWDGNPLHSAEDLETNDSESIQTCKVARKILVYLRLDGLPGLFTMVSLLGGKREENMETTNSPQTESLLKNPGALTSVTTLHHPIRIHGLRLMELTERDSSVMKVTEIEEFASRDPVIKAFGTFGQSHDIAIGGQIAVVPEHLFSDTLTSQAQYLRSDFILMPWSESGTMSEYMSIFAEKPGNNPLANRPFAGLVSETFEKARTTCNVGVFVDKTLLTQSVGTIKHDHDRSTDNVITRQLSRTMTGISLSDQKNSTTVQFRLPDSRRHQLLVLYQSNMDDLFAVKLALQLARNDNVDVKILSTTKSTSASIGSTDGGNEKQRPSRGEEVDPSELESLRNNLSTGTGSMASRVSFTDVPSSASAIDFITSSTSAQDSNYPAAAETILVLGRGTPDSYHSSSLTSSSTSLSREADVRTLGPVASTALAVVRDRGLALSVLVVQARREDNSTPLES